jgi:phage host-nuclease inhibitor protein Gam
VAAVTEQKAITKDVQAYCEAHKIELLPKGKKSADLGVGVFGWRQSPPSVKLLCKDEEAVAALNNDADRDLLREVLVLNKDAVLALRTTMLEHERQNDGERAAVLLERIESLQSRGVLKIVVGREKFFVEPTTKPLPAKEAE